MRGILGTVQFFDALSSAEDVLAIVPDFKCAVKT